MKKIKILAIALLLTISTLSNAQPKKINTEKSTINWLAKKVTGQHSGTIALKDGALIFKGKKLVGGTFTTDMTKINVTDLKAGEGKEKLEGHLNSPDFFGTEKFTTSTLIFKNVVDKGNGIYTVIADLTIKSYTNPVTFDLTVTDKTAKTTVIVDRTKFDIKYGSGSFFQGLGDKVINDNFDLTVNLVF